MGKIIYVSISVFFVVLVLFGLIFLSSDMGDESTVTGAFSLLELAPAGYEYDEPEDVTQNVAEDALKKAQTDIDDMKSQNMITLFAEDSLREAESAMKDENFTHVLMLTQLVGYVKKEKIDFLDRLRLIQIRKQTLEEKDVKGLGKINDITLQAMNAFSLDQLDRANELLDVANEELKKAGKEHSRLKMLSLVSKNFFLRYWWQILIVIVLLIMAAPFVVQKMRKNMLKRKIAHMKIGLNETKGLIKRMQKECFVDKTMTIKLYKERAAKYEEKITEIKHTIPVLEAQVKKEGKLTKWMGGIFSRNSKKKVKNPSGKKEKK